MRWCLLTIVFLTTGTGCSRSGRQVEYVIPDGHRGRLWVLLDLQAPELPLVDGRYRVEFPKDGVLRVRSMQPLELWHHSSARFADGTPLPTVLVQGQSPHVTSAVAMWSLARGSTWPDKRDYIAWVVGTEVEAKAVGLEQFDPPMPR